jgi:hypothetical protein
MIGNQWVVAKGDGHWHGLCFAVYARCVRVRVCGAKWGGGGGREREIERTEAHNVSSGVRHPVVSGVPAG